MKTYTRTLIPRARSMRSNMPAPEKRMWYQCLKHLPYRFRRQRPLGPYIVDFYCAELKLVIEIDGDSHATDAAQNYDDERSLFLQSQGLRVLRFSNHEVMQNIDAVFDQLQKEIGLDPDPP